MNGTRVRNAAELRGLLEHMRDREPFFAELIGDSGYKLLLGIGPTEGCVQHSATDGSPPYVMAVANADSDALGEVEFLIGDVPSPVARRYCLPYDTMVEVAAWFADSGDRHSGVTWEEV